MTASKQWCSGGARAATPGITFLHSTKIASEKSLSNNKSYKSGNNINDKWFDISLSEFYVFESIIDYWDETMADMSKDFFCSVRLFFWKGKVWGANSSFAPGASNSRCTSASRIFHQHSLGAKVKFSWQVKVQSRICKFFYKANAEAEERETAQTSSGEIGPWINLLVLPENLISIFAKSNNIYSNLK